MNKRILVAMDDSDSGEFIFEHAIRLAQEHKSDLKLLHVLSAQDQSLAAQQPLSNLFQSTQTISSLKYGQTSTLLESNSERKMLGRLVGCVERAESLQLTADYICMIGKPGQTICEIALSWHADLIVLGGTDQTIDKSSSDDSIKNFVVHHAPCSVEVVRLSQEKTSPTLLVNELLLSHLSGWQ